MIAARGCELAQAVGDRAVACAVTSSFVVTLHRFTPVQSTQRVHVCDRHVGHAVAALDGEADMPLEITATSHGARLWSSLVSASFPTLDLERVPA